MGGAERQRLEKRQQSVVSVKSRVFNILPASPCDSIFCREKAASVCGKLFNINKLRNIIRKNLPLPLHVEGASAVVSKSFAWNILQVSPCGSRFCLEAMRSDSSNPSIFEYFTEMYRKICGRNPACQLPRFQDLTRKILGSLDLAVE